jgi:RNA polymerase sigma-70 factor (ECF subfamily)
VDKGSSYYQQFLSGDNAGLEQIIIEYKDGLILYLNTLVGDILVAEELAEDTFVRLFTKKPKDKQTGSFKTWLYTIGRNLAISHLRRAKHQTAVSVDTLEYLSDGSGEPLPIYLKEEQKQAVHRAMEGLRPQYRQILWLIYFENLSFKEAAAIMQKSVHSTQMLATRARQAMKDALNGMEVPL